MKTAKRHTFPNEPTTTLLVLEFLANHPTSAEITGVNTEDKTISVDLYASDLAHENIITYVNNNL